MPRHLPLALAAALLVALGFLGLRSTHEPAPAPAPAPAAPAPAAAVQEAAPEPGTAPELPGGLVERAQALLAGSKTGVAAGTPGGTLLLTGHAAAGADPVDAWRRPLHELRELFVGMPGLLGVEYDLESGGKRATLHVTRQIAERMRLVKDLDRMHGQREALLVQRTSGAIDAATYDRQVHELERSTFGDLLVMIPAEARDIPPELQIR
jgi:hypothetical protein